MIQGRVLGRNRGGPASEPVVLSGLDIVYSRGFGSLGEGDAIAVINSVALGACLRDRVAEEEGVVLELAETEDHLCWRLHGPAPNDEPAVLIADREILDPLPWGVVYTEFLEQDPVRMALEYRDYILRTGDGATSVILQERGTWKHGEK